VQKIALLPCASVCFRHQSSFHRTPVDDRVSRFILPFRLSDANFRASIPRNRKCEVRSHSLN
jgi:hypothetical protein